MTLQNKTNEHVIIVDEQDAALGCEEKIKAHIDGKLHRAFSIFILRNKKNKIELLLQKRNKKKYHSGGLWTNTCCGHPRPNEELIFAAKRRLKEEMGFETELKNIGNFTYKFTFDNGLSEHELDHVLLGFYDIEKPAFNYDEVMATSWKNILEIKKDLENNPKIYTPWLAKSLDLIIKNLEKKSKQ